MLLLQGLRFTFPAGSELAFPGFEAPQGANVLVRGASGSGKSTLLALMAGLLSPSSGKLVVADAEPARMQPRARDAWRARTLGFVPQRLHLSDALSVRANLELPYIACGEAIDNRRVDALLAGLGLAALESRKPHELSLGQAQRVALARALLRHPRLILVDEPSAHLDDDSCADMLTLLRRQAEQEGASLVVATHDRRVAAALPQAVQLQLG